MTRIPSLIAAIADAALTVAIGFVIPLAITLASWLITGGFQTTAVELPVTVAASIWALGLGGGVGFSISPETYPALGIAEPFRFVISVAPLAFTAFIAWMGWRAGDGLSDDDAPWAGLGASTVTFALASWLSLAFATAEPMRIDVAGAVVVGTCTWLVMLLFGLRVWEYLPWEKWLGARVSDLTDLAPRALRIATGLVVGTLALATIALLVALVTSMGRVIGLMEALQLDVASIIGIGLLQLAYLPTMIVWAAAWLLGPGIQLGAGSTATLGGTDAGPLPVLPLLGMLPEGSSPYLWALIALPLALAAVIALIARNRNPGIDARVWWERLLPPAAGALAAAVALAVAAQLSRGSLGPGRLTEFGPEPWWMLLAAFGLFTLGGAIGAFLPLESSADVDSRDADSRDGVRKDSARKDSAREERVEADEESHADESDPRTRPHVIPFQSFFDRILGGHDDEDEDDDERETASAARQDDEGDSASQDVEVGDVDAAKAAEKRPRVSPYARPKQRIELRDAVNRSDEPDIYADIDPSEDPK
ncbi:cell division protein PerM [Gulosibacter molinativorax]|uniref:Uncharacterized protein n=1 Tax=Gulosibacter molinativorax TaxID=256821 RepID=A0ABT7C447_9MICO|nr:DUF6350 family protein [Gulosibacter molinativorax]MDJ1369999.1 hypothetical protein [Gulosibacter molinativorax]QUY63811.1 Hypotetical protein [Gulosibacter molinativorax]